MKPVKPMRVMFLGTCRMHDPYNVLREDPRFRIKSTPHRLHTTNQTLQFARHMLGPDLYRPDMAHLISDYASKCIYEDGQTRHQIIDELAQIRRIWLSFDAFVIEISALREPVAKLAGGPSMTVNNFSERDQGKHAAQIARDAEAGLSLPLLEMSFEPSTPSATQTRMTEIKKALGGRAIIWVSHQRPPSTDPRYDVVNKVRLHLADTLKAGARSMGDIFFDPSLVAKEIGQKAFFQRDGEDLDHMTTEAATALAARYAEILLNIRKRRSSF